MLYIMLPLAGGLTGLGFGNDSLLNILLPCIMVLVGQLFLRSDGRLCSGLEAA